MNEENEIDLVAPTQADEIFFAALDYETDDERRAFVEEACLGDAELRQKVYCLFESLAAAEGFFEDVAAQFIIPAKDLVDILNNRLEAFSSFPSLFSPLCVPKQTTLNPLREEPVEQNN